MDAGEIMALKGEIISAKDVSSKDIDRMFVLMDEHFLSMDASRFRKDLSEKDSVLILRHPESGIVQGFSTSLSIDTVLDGQQVRAVYSGDTIINKEFWGEKTLGVLWLRHVLRIQREVPEKKVYWFLISMGYKTYRLMRLFFKQYWPRYDESTPLFERKLMDHLAQMKFASNYCPKTGIISFEGKREKLRCGIADVDESRRKDRDISFFVKANPRWQQGDELVCLAEIHPDNLRPRMWRIFKLDREDGAS